MSPKRNFSITNELIENSIHLESLQSTSERETRLKKISEELDEIMESVFIE